MTNKKNLLGVVDLSVTLAIPPKGGTALVMPRPQTMRATNNIVGGSSSFQYPRKSDFFQSREPTFISYPFVVTGGMTLLTKGVHRLLCLN